MNYKFFSNKKCEYYPCHSYDGDFFNCLFCYCPLYFLDCFGDYTILPNGIKDCSNCLIPHDPKNFDKIISFLNNHLTKS